MQRPASLKNISETVINQLGVSKPKLLLGLCRIPVQTDTLQGPMGRLQNRTAGCFINATALHTYQPILHQVNLPNTMSAAELIEFLQ